MNLLLKRRIEQIKQRWWVVVAISALTVTLAGVSVLVAHTTYVGKAELVVSSPGRAPDQDAALIQGYSALFNNPATIARLQAANHIPDGIAFEAKPVAASPILTIEATADDAKAAETAAQDMAAAFREDINAMREADKKKRLAELTSQLERTQPASDNPINPLLAPPLQDEIFNTRNDFTNELQDLPLRVGVTTNAQHGMRGLVLPAAGGLLLGLLGALGVSVLSTRLRGSADMREKTDVEPLVEVPEAGSVARNRLREHRLRTLANIVSSGDLNMPTVVALTDTRGVHGAQDLARTLAELWAKQGHRTVLVYADDASCQDGTEGFIDILTDGSWINRFDNVLHDTAIASMKILPGGSVVADRCSRVTRERICAILDKLQSAADIVVVAAPSIADSIEAQLLCAAADRTVLVVARGKSRAGDVTAAAEALAKAQAVVLGAVLIDGSNEGQAGRLHTRRSVAVGSLSQPITGPVNLQRSVPEEKVLADSRLNRHG
jgi:Mrp family chromosome partitioning ATPase/capsular polysaccharide biosynthesis protein